MKKSEYHAMTDIVSSTGLKQLRKDEQVYFDTYEQPDPALRRPPFTETKPMETGQILHEMILERNPLRSIVGVYPEYNPDVAEIHKLSGKTRDELGADELKRYAKACKTPLDVFMVAPGGKKPGGLDTIKAKCPKNVMGKDGNLTSESKRFREAHPEYKYFVKRSEAENLKLAAASIRSSQYYRLLERDDMMRETPLFWTDAETGLKCRCMPDFMVIAGREAFIWDLKISMYAIEFEKQMNQLDYHIQDEHYSSGVRANYDVDKVTYTFVACLPVYPYHVTENMFFDTDPLQPNAKSCRPTIQKDYRATMAYLAKLRETGDWRQPATKETQYPRIWKRTAKYVSDEDFQ